MHLRFPVFAADSGYGLLLVPRVWVDGGQTEPPDNHAKRAGAFTKGSKLPLVSSLSFGVLRLVSLRCHISDPKRSLSSTLFRKLSPGELCRSKDTPRDTNFGSYPSARVPSNLPASFGRLSLVAMLYLTWICRRLHESCVPGTGQSTA